MMGQLDSWTANLGGKQSWFNLAALVWFPLLLSHTSRHSTFLVINHLLCNGRSQSNHTYALQV